MKRFHSAIAATLVLGALALLTSCGQTSYSDLAAKPERTAELPPAVKEESLVTLNALFPYETDAGVQIVVGFEGSANIVVLNRPAR